MWTKKPKMPIVYHWTIPVTFSRSTKNITAWFLANLIQLLYSAIGISSSCKIVLVSLLHENGWTRDPMHVDKFLIQKASWWNSRKTKIQHKGKKLHSQCDRFENWTNPIMINNQNTSHQRKYLLINSSISFYFISFVFILINLFKLFFVFFSLWQTRWPSG